MTAKKHSTSPIDLKTLVADDRDLMKSLMKEALQEVLEAEMTELLGAGPHEREEGRRGYRAGHYERGLVTRIGKLELRVPRDRNGQFQTALFERYQRSEKAFVAALAEMYVQGVSTRKVKIITEELCGHGFSASSISAINKSLDEALTAFAERRLDEPYPYLILDARDEKVREGGVIRSQAVLIAIGIHEGGRREVLAVDVASRESQSSWKDFLVRLKDRKAPAEAPGRLLARCDGCAAQGLRPSGHGRTAVQGSAAGPHDDDSPTGQPAAPCRSARPRRHRGACR